MVSVENYKPFEDQIWFYCEEGTATVGKDAENVEYIIFSAPVKKGDLVKLDTKDKTVVPANAKGDAGAIIGEVLDNPAFRHDRPAQTSSTGQYNMRICTVRVWGDYVRSCQLKDENSAVAVGDAIGYEGNNTFDKAVSGNTIALASAGAGSKKKIPVLFGYRGL